MTPRASLVPDNLNDDDSSAAERGAASPRSLPDESVATRVYVLDKEERPGTQA